MLKEILENVREARPLVQNITNFVTVNDCANITLAIGASPTMADDVEEVEEISSICSSLNLNVGTLRKAPAMLKAGKRAKELGHPIVMDPVGAGASVPRTETARLIMKEVKPDVIRGNISEIKSLAIGGATTKGVDANECDLVTRENLDKAVEMAKSFAQNSGAVIAITGAIDIVADSERAYCIFNGDKRMSDITGTGCMLSSLIGAFIGANKDNILNAVATAVISMGVCGEIGAERLSSKDGNASYRNYIIDAVYNLTGDDLERRAKYEIR